MIPERPTDKQVDRLVAVIEPFSRITRPKLYASANVPKSGALLVGNHTVFGLLDVPFMMAELWKRERVLARGLGDHAHYGIPGWRDLLETCGMVRGTRENVHALMEAGENVLVFPGGSREVNKRRGEKYQLIWKERLGFAKLAIAHGYPIVPFAAVGAEEMYDIVLDDDNPVYRRFTSLVQKVTGFPLMPVGRGVGPTLLPRPERLYFWFGERIDTARFGGDAGDAAAREVRDATRKAIEGGIAFLHDERDKDPGRGLLKRLSALGSDV